jgi:phosphohistidine phosphatase
MDLYVVRHGEAARYAPGGDAERPLTAQGARQVEAVARGLRGLGVELDALLASPLRRAQETALLLAKGLGGKPAPEAEAVLDGTANAAAILQHLAHAVRSRARIAIVGHQPVLGELVGLASAGSNGGAVALAPACVARLAFPGAARVGGAQLVWLLPPEVLERVASPGA